MRVNELAKELNVGVKDLMDMIQSVLRVDLKSETAMLAPEQVTAVRRTVAPAARAAAAAAAAPPAPLPPAEEAPPPAAEPPPPVDPASADETQPEEPTSNVLVIKPPMVVRDLAEMMGIKPNVLIAGLMGMNIFASINQKIELKAIQALAEKHGFKVELEKKAPKTPPPPPKEKAEKKVEVADTSDDLAPRPPVVAFMGHVDHGKTSLLDRIRNAKVAAGEDGGITQHIGAYTVKSARGSITFLDTPGHEAFTKMRARGANLTDIVVIVIDAVDGMMPQTREAIQHAKASGVCIMVAINKIDLRAANPDRVKQQLQGENLAPEDWGGTTVCCPVSAMTGEGVDHLLDMINLQAEVLELKANARRKAQGYVIEAQLEAGMGPTASLLVRNGTLRAGDAIMVGPHWGKVKALIDDQGKKVKEAGPSYAVKCLGLSGVPEAGAEFVVAENEKAARETSELRTAEIREKSLSATQPKRASLESLLQRAESGEKKEFHVIIKADVQGSIEAILHIIEGIKSTKVGIKALLTGVGNITNNDVLLASASDALIIGFHVSTENGVNSLAKREGIEIKLYNIIYELMDDVKNMMAGLLDPILKETVNGQVEIKQVFDLGKKGKVAGCLVKSGKITARSRARVRRRGDIVFEGAVANLKRFQNDASEVREGQECGIRLDHFTDFETGDIIEAYEVEKIVQQL
ncbi:MAG TPA: translation initiation factor IF-2 [Kiritimatiellia bacterium]|nr:translation initiation factor IF-2 [Kiritimatiellia bacterium]HMO97547.1 translation initiation factor IF-2 [Kiritimatiellia bacterium]HMP97015.1 translation initiation factor IF-2 [Kiritimatiellia bacterium]